MTAILSPRVLALVGLLGCTTPSTDTPTGDAGPDPSMFGVGGTVSGLEGTVTLQLDGGEHLALAQNGAFRFATELARGASYVVTVSGQPEGQICTVNQAVGTIGAADVDNIAVICSASSYAVAGTISGLRGFIVLQNNGADDLTVAANGDFVFGTKVADGAGYSVTIHTQPTGQICTVANATGTIAGAAASGVTVTCTSQTYSLGGSISGLDGTIVLQNNGGDDRTVTASGAFTFATPLVFDASYVVTVKTQPAGQTCTVTNGTGTMGTAAVTNIQVVCATNTFAVGGTITGLSGTLVLQNNGADDLSLTNTTTFTFATQVAQGGSYSVTVKQHPAHQACTVTNGSGTNVQATVTNVQVTCIAFDIQDVSTSGSSTGHTLAIVNGQLWAWGSNTDGQLGNNSTTSLQKPTQIGTVNTWTAVSAGGSHSMAVRQNGTLWTWGDNRFGQLGDGTAIAQYDEPRQIGVADQWLGVSAGLYTSYAIRTDRTLWGWGEDYYRQLGDGNASTLSPIQVDTATNWEVIGQSAVSTIGRRTDGTIWGRGFNTQGQLGDGTTTTQTTWVQAGNGTSWAAVSVGGAIDATMNAPSHTLALRSDGRLFAWGDNSAGQLGNGTTTSSSVPIQIGNSTWLEVAAGARYSLGIRSDGTLWAWGDNSYRQLGDGTTTTRLAPVQIGTANNWETVRAGLVRSYGIRTDDTLWGWGYGADGHLGDNTFTNRAAPVRILP